MNGPFLAILRDFIIIVVGVLIIISVFTDAF